MGDEGSGQRVNAPSGLMTRSIANGHGMITYMLRTGRFRILSAKHPFKNMSNKIDCTIFHLPERAIAQPSTAVCASGLILCNGTI